MKEFLWSRRARETLEDTGLAVGDTRIRRTPGLRREKVAVLAGVRYCDVTSPYSSPMIRRGTSADRG